MTIARNCDVIIAGGGIIGLSLGLELRRRGLSVIVLERHRAMRAASWAAGGMLAAHDPETPSALVPLAVRSLALYPEYLDHIEALSGSHVPLRTRRTLLQLRARQSASHLARPATVIDARKWIPGLTEEAPNLIWLEEDSLDPRDLCHALPAAFRASGGILLEATAALAIELSGPGVDVTTAAERIHAAEFVNCGGAWAGDLHMQGIQPDGVPVTPVKGQMVTVMLNADRLRCVLRSPQFYAIPRGDGRVAIGATAEYVGFDETVEPAKIAGILRNASQLLPEIENAPQVESWAGLRPGTPDGLPILGAAETEHCWHATGHYRNGVLLAPATARVIAQAILSEQSDVPLENFALSRFAAINANSPS